MHWLQRYSCLTGTANLEVRHRQYLYKDLSIFQLYFSILVMAFAASPSGATSVMLSTHFFDQNSAQNEFQLLRSGVSTPIAATSVEKRTLMCLTTK